MSQPQLPMWQRWAQFRYAVIGELLSCPPPKGQLQQCIGELAQKNYRHPIDANRRISFGSSTIERWYYKAKDAADPIAVLGRKIRSDSGIRWSMPEALLQELKSQYTNYPRWNVQLHYDNLKVVAKEQPGLGAVPSYKTVLRCMRENGWLKTNEPAQPTDGQWQAALRRQKREIRGFEVSHVHGLWHLDFHQAKIGILDTLGKWHRPVVLAILDDHSRLCCHLQLYLAETAQCLIHGFRAYGLALSRGAMRRAFNTAGRAGLYFTICGTLRRR